MTPQLPWKQPGSSATNQTCPPEDFDLCQSTTQDNRRPVPVSVSDGGETSVLSHVAVCPSSPACLFANPPETSWSETQEALSAACPKAHARHRHPIKALGTPCSKLSQLGCIWAQIFEKCSMVRVPLAQHQRIPLPKQKFGGGEGVWMLRMCIRRVYTQVSSVSLLLTRTYQTDMKVRTVCIYLSTLSTEVRL